MNVSRRIVSFLAIIVASGCSSDSKTVAKLTPSEELAKELKTIGGCMGNKCGPSTDDFFSNEHFATLNLTFTKAELEPYAKDLGLDDITPDHWEDLIWSKWKSQCGNYEWIPVNMEYVPGNGGPTWQLNKVGMRMRGSKKRGANPLGGFKLDYNEFLPEGGERRFADLNRYELLSNEKDSTGMVQCMTYQLMRDFGLEAPRCNHVKVTVNGKVYGMMESVERAKDKRYLTHHFDNPEGPLFGSSTGNAVCGYPLSLGDFEYKGETFTGEYLKIYEIIKGNEADAEKFLIPMLKCVDNVTTPNDEDFKACIKDWIDVEEWLKLTAAESLTPTVEDFVGARRNTFLYFEPNEFAKNGGRFRPWGWDYDTALQRQNCYDPNPTGDPPCNDPFNSVAAWYGPNGRRAKFVARLTNVFREQYCGLMREFLDTVYLPEKVTHMASVIQSGMAGDPVMLAQGWDWPQEVAKMHDFMVKHRAELQTTVTSLCGASNTPMQGIAGAAGAAGGPSGSAGAAGWASSAGTAGAGGAGH